MERTRTPDDNIKALPRRDSPVEADRRDALIVLLNGALARAVADLSARRAA